MYQDRTWYEGRHWRRRFLKLGYGVAIIGLGFFGMTRITASKHAAAQVADAATVKAVADENAKKVATFQTQLQTLFAANTNVSFSVAVAADGHSVATYGNTGAYDAASVGKLITAADYLRHVDQGTATLNTKIDGSKASNLLDIMIVNSDDDAWLDLNRYLGHTDLANYASSIGLTNYNPATNTFPASDAVLLLQKLQQDELVSDSSTNLLMGYLAKANYRGYIIPAVPAGYQVYHKVGLDEDNVHDVAIITHNGKTLVLAIFTNGNGTYEWNQRAALMQTITRDAIAAYLP